MEYENMLDRLYMVLPDRTASKERFEMPVLEASVQGKKTIVRNFSQALKAVGRDEKQFYKYVTKETATAATMDEGKLVLNGKFFSDNINRLWQNYLNEYVLCHECKKPDTQIIERNDVKVLKCTACGAMSAIRKL
ncbi:Translation initiation factor 2 subunit beta [uncultured archaeon]|nr:Translation initiation factor 2 subunit beta [uncultured archaeon]